MLEAWSTPEALAVRFEGGRLMSASLRAEDYTTPEAASYEPDGGPIVVFNEG